MSIYTDDTVKNIQILNGNEDITASVKSGSLKIDNILCDGQLSFGACNTARAQMVTISDLDLTGSRITVKYGAGRTFETLGIFDVTYSSKRANSEEVTVTMYDVMKRFDVNVAEWYEQRALPMTLQNFRTQFCNFIGVQQESAQLVNDSMLVDRTISPSKLNGMDLLRYIGEINGVFPHATSDGKLSWVSLGTTAKTITKTVVQGSDGVEQKDYTTKPISKLCVRTQDGDIGVSVGTGNNTYYVTANVLVYGLTDAQLTPIATNLYNKIAGNSYTPTRINMKCDPTIRLGELISYEGTQFYVLSRKTSGLLFDEIEAGGNEYIEEVDDVNTSLEQLRGKSNVLTRDIESTTSRVENIEDDYTTHTEFTQQAESFNLQIEQLQAQIDGSVELYTVNYVPTRENYPAWDWTGMYCDGTYTASDDLHFLYPTSELQRHLRTMAYNEDSGLTYRFTKIDNEYVWQEVADTETAVILSRLTAVEATTEGLTVSVSEVTADLADNYLTTTETRNEIQAKADAIELSVAGTYATQETTTNISASVNLKLNKTDLVSEFNAKANVITLTSDNFKLSANGDLWAQNVDIAGKLTAENGGNIGGWTVSKNTNLYADGAGYRAYMQKPKDANTWVFSTQSQVSGSLYNGNWFVTAAGIEKANKLFVGATPQSQDMDLYVSGSTYMNGTLRAGASTLTSVTTDSVSANSLNATSILSSAITCGTYTTTASAITFQKKCKFSGGVASEEIMTQKQHGLTYKCAGTTNDVVFYWTDGHFSVYVDNVFVGSLTPA